MIYWFNKKSKMKKLSLLIACLWIFHTGGAQSNLKKVPRPTYTIEAGIKELRNVNLSSMNYHNAISFDGQYDFDQIDMKKISDITLFAVYSNNSGTDVVANIENSAIPFQIKSNSVVHRQKLGFQDTKEKPKLLMIKDRISTKSKKSKYLNFGDLTKEGRNFNGILGDVFVYNRHLNISEIKIIETSLALKYGIPFSDTSKYYNSNYECIFDAKSNNPYSYNVTAIGYDKGTWFDQCQSKSSYSEVDITISSKPLEKRNATYGIIDKNQQIYIFLSDNNADASFRASEKFLSVSEMDRRWKLQFFGEMNETSIPNELIVTLGPESIKNFDKEKATYLMYKDFGKNKYIRLNFTQNGTLSATIPKQFISRPFIFSLVQTNPNQSIIYATDYNCETQKGSISYEVLEQTDIELNLIQNDVILMSLSLSNTSTIEGLDVGTYTMQTINSLHQKEIKKLVLKPSNCDDEVKIYPNPCFVGQKIILQSKDIALEDVEIFASDGKLIQQHFDISNNIFEFTILKPGIYSVNIKDFHRKNLVKSLIVIE